MGTDSTRSTTRAPRLHVVVGEQLAATLRQAAPGTPVASEQELVTELGVPRSVVRGALDHLVERDIIGAGDDGVYRVLDIDHGTVTESIARFLAQRGTTEPERIHEVREALELSTVALAAERATDAQLAAVRAAWSRVDALDTRLPEAPQADIAFHRAIAEAANNELFVLLIDSLNDVLLHARQATASSPEQVAVVNVQHRTIVEALERRDADAAVEAMRTHLAAAVALYRASIAPD